MLGDIVETVYTSLVGAVSLVFFLGVAAYIMFESNSRWREFEGLYLARPSQKPASCKLTGAVRISQPGYRWGHLSGDLKSHRHPPVMVGIREDGLWLSIVPPFKYGCRDLFLPFDKMQISPTDWDLVSGTYGIRMQGVAGIEMLMFGNILKWAAKRAPALQEKLQQAEIERSGQAA
ncbi:MAG: hypothetical protein SXU28_05395 [Pseudomonadota bacterium]|nr:hypothetical protein [Pseudomonadota bacterium]